MAAEAVACGTPVIAYRDGGALDIVQEGRNGVFFDRQDPESLAAAIARFDASRFQPRAVSETAQRFSRPRFEAGMLAMVHQVRASRRTEASQQRERSWQRVAL